MNVVDAISTHLVTHGIICGVCGGAVVYSITELFAAIIIVILNQFCLLAIIPKQPIITCLGRLANCGICGCQSNLWSRNSAYFEGRLICPGRRHDPELHDRISKWQESLTGSELPDSVLERIAIDILRAQAKFKKFSIASEEN